MFLRIPVYVYIMVNFQSFGRVEVKRYNIDVEMWFSKNMFQSKEFGVFLGMCSIRIIKYFIVMFMKMYYGIQNIIFNFKTFPDIQ